MLIHTLMLPACVDRWLCLKLLSLLVSYFNFCACKIFVVQLSWKNKSCSLTVKAEQFGPVDKAW